jgi:hypothetical protein
METLKIGLKPTSPVNVEGWQFLTFKSTCKDNSYRMGTFKNIQETPDYKCRTENSSAATGEYISTKNQ